MECSLGGFLHFSVGSGVPLLYYSSPLHLHYFFPGLCSCPRPTATPTVPIAGMIPKQDAVTRLWSLDVRLPDGVGRVFISSSKCGIHSGRSTACGWDSPLALLPGKPPLRVQGWQSGRHLLGLLVLRGQSQPARWPNVTSFPSKGGKVW